MDVSIVFLRPIPLEESTDEIRLLGRFFREKTIVFDGLSKFDSVSCCKLTDLSPKLCTLGSFTNILFPAWSLATSLTKSV